MRVLALSAHTDDAELGCGGTLATFTAAGHDVRYVAFSAAEDSIPAPHPRDVLRREVLAATRALGLNSDSVEVRHYAVRSFPARRQELLDDLVQLRSDYRPDLVLLPSENDVHQDHGTLAQEGFRAFKQTTMLAYELPWNMRTFRGDAFVPLTASCVEIKLRALQAYASQADRPYMRGFSTELARVRGIQAGVEYAEAFEVVRWIVNPSDFKS